ncbi:GNAT family N-acetyltransferase [Romboutsia maritimum]|uniref:GNAT family N-acetyltransferase n=1 Tax=Romboutsia maritimum TaxID=2020948 RepID=A0A371IPN5_9FIRM|nr:GNAT family N-acetyltransferase [Romboutsia maritimum]RDY22441.1 GNAT family N-acetyltransferase [Romboutsia maritimum]
MIKTVKLSKFNGKLCENLYGDVCFITPDKFNDVVDLYHRVHSTMDNKNWLKFRDVFYLKDILDKGGFIVGCYIEDILVASALCEIPSGDYINYISEMDLDYDLNDIFVSGFVMVDPLYRGNSLHRILLETRIESSIKRGKKYIVTAIATENIYSINTVVNLGFEAKFQRKNEYGITRNVYIKKLDSEASKNVKDVEFTA